MDNLKTWPEIVFLQIGDDYYEELPQYAEFGDYQITWCADSVVSIEVKYVRADVLDAANATIATLNQHIEDYKIALESERADNSLYENQLDQANATIAELREEIELSSIRAERSLKRKKHYMQWSVQRREQLSAEIAHLKAKLAEAETTKKTICNSHVTEVRKLQHQITELERLNVYEQSRLSEANAELHKWRNGHQLGGMVEDMTAEIARGAELEKEIAHLKAKLAENCAQKQKNTQSGF